MIIIHIYLFIILYFLLKFNWIQILNEFIIYGKTDGNYVLHQYAINETHNGYTILTHYYNATVKIVYNGNKYCNLSITGKYTYNEIQQHIIKLNNQNNYKIYFINNNKCNSFYNDIVKDKNIDIANDKNIDINNDYKTFYYYLIK